ncbi:hypothetical protein [Kitasatospora aureofaciens]|uniref:hypothetical protein n=1 Tax=Kitasatospora aureofaciens TaxID=1894 RepID=UPI00131D598E|nr:hypothetical protein [Kitasatospora aureofaciens]
MTAHPVVLPEPAPASAQWIVDQLAKNPPQPCPAPTLANLAVLDRSEDAQDRADVVWLRDDSYLCLASISRVNGGLTTGFSYGSIESYTAGRSPSTIGGLRQPSFFTVFPVDTGQVVLRGGGSRFGPLHQRTVDLGAGRAITVVQYRYAVQPTPDPDSSVVELPPKEDPDHPAKLCPSVEEPCRLADVY